MPGAPAHVTTKRQLTACGRTSRVGYCALLPPARTPGIGPTIRGNRPSRAALLQALAGPRADRATPRI